MARDPAAWAQFFKDVYPFQFTNGPSGITFVPIHARWDPTSIFTFVHLVVTQHYFFWSCSNTMMASDFDYLTIQMCMFPWLAHAGKWLLGSPVRSHRRQLVRSRIMDDFEGRRRDIWEFETQSKDMRPHIRPTVAILKIKYGSGTNPKWWSEQQPHVSWRIPSCSLDATWAKKTTDLMGNVKMFLR